jgi:hypothetical protein
MMRELTHGWRNWFRRARTEFVAAARQRPRRVCKALSKRCQRAPTFLKISTIFFRKRKAFAFETRRISHAVRASNLLRFGGRPPHPGSADARQKFQREFAHGEGNRSACGLLLPCLPAVGRRFVGATALSGDGFQGVSSIPLRRKEPDRRNAITADDRNRCGLRRQCRRLQAPVAGPLGHGVDALLGGACITSCPRHRDNGGNFEPIRPVPPTITILAALSRKPRQSPRCIPRTSCKAPL